MNKMQKQVLDFHKKTGVEPQPHKPVDDLQQTDMALRIDLIKEEMSELVEAVIDSDLNEVVDALGDLLYVTFGTAIVLGVDMEPIFNEIHRTNMLKNSKHQRKDGKITKPPGWEPPAIKKCLDEQRQATEYSDRIGELFKARVLSESSGSV